MSFCKINDCSRQVTYPAEVESGFCVEHLHLHIGDLKTQAEIASASCEARGKKLEVARDAIAYALRRVGMDPEFAYHMLFTETLERLIKAYAALSGRETQAIHAELRQQTKNLPQSRCATDREFIDGGCQL